MKKFELEGDQSIHESNVNKQTWKKFIDKVEFQSVTIERDTGKIKF